jgi:putative FmdB family regulatory protein
MPIYEYTCRTCGADFEHWHASMKDVASPACPACASAEVQRRFSVPAIKTGGGTASDAAQESAAAPAKPEIFGRKELNEALRRQGIKPDKE